LGVQMVTGELTEFEVDLAKKLCRDKYATDDWNSHGKSILN
jgi:hypothetical protein